METTPDTHVDQRTTSRVRGAVTRLALATAVSSTALMLAAEAAHAHARIAVNHNEAAGSDRP